MALPLAAIWSGNFSFRHDSREVAEQLGTAIVTASHVMATTGCRNLAAPLVALQTGITQYSTSARAWSIKLRHDAFAVACAAVVRSNRICDMHEF